MIAKLFIFWCICEVIVFASSASLKESYESGIRIPRTPFDSFSSFGFNLGNPILSFVPRPRQPYEPVEVTTRREPQHFADSIMHNANKIPHERHGPHRNDFFSPDNVKSKNVIDNQNDIKDEIDKAYLDQIFKIQNSSDGITTTEDTPIDSTTGDYDTSTIDDLLRIPPNVVASLLG